MKPIYAFDFKNDWGYAITLKRYTITLHKYKRIDIERKKNRYHDIWLDEVFYLQKDKDNNNVLCRYLDKDFECIMTFEPYTHTVNTLKNERIEFEIDIKFYKEIYKDIKALPFNASDSVVIDLFEKHTSVLKHLLDAYKKQ